MILHGRLLIDPASPAQLGWVRVEHGRIAEMGEGDLPAGMGPPAHGGASHVITPAFFDAHCHLPQTDSVGVDGLPLLEWLNRAVFPAEMWWGRGAAPHMAMTAVRRHQREGTAGIAAYLTSHGAINREVLTMLAAKTPMRFIAGRVGMDRLAPEELLEEDWDRVRQRPVRPCVLPKVGNDLPGLPQRHVVSGNPRFAVTCSEELLAEFGWWVKDNATGVKDGPWIQTHLSESPDELAKIMELFPPPRDRDYTSVYDRFGLLTERTLLAHAIHLSDDERALIAARRSIVVHCPTANLFLQSGLFNLDKAREFGLRVALGSDIAGGPDVAMPRVARAMIETAKVRRMVRRAGEPSVRIPTPAEAWSMITRENAEMLGWGDCGRLEVNATAALLVLRVPETWLDEHLVGRLIYGWDASLIEARVGL
ncbi:MAG: amidohydrolase family protein [Phycisphaerales bacterium]